MGDDRPRILVPPPVAFLAALGGALAADAWFPLGLLPAFPWIPGLVLGLPVLVAAVVINVSGFLAFQRAGTNVNPYKPALKLVRGGVFRITRNPMYLGMVLILVGLGPAGSNLWALIAAVLLWALLHWGVVLREERYMSDKFGASYRDLLASTQRWL